MRIENKSFALVGILGAVALFSACPEGGPAFQQPDGSVAINFTVDATGRADYYEDESFEWKGAFTYDGTTRIMTYASDWAGGEGPYAPLYDDGPWTMGGHEPIGAVAGDDKFGITVFLMKPAEELTIEYGAQTCCGSSGGWIWPGSTNGSVTVGPTTTGPVTADGMTLPAEGTTDLKLMLDTSALSGGHTIASGRAVKVKGTFSDWAVDQAYDDGTHGDPTASDGIYTYTLSENEARRLYPASGAEVEFIWIFCVAGTDCAEGDNGAPYKGSSEAETGGVMAATKGASESTYTTRTVTLADNGNTQVAIP